MKKMLLVDGNSLFFRAYYATAYTRMTTTSFGVPTNAVFGFATMLNKAIELVSPQAMVIAFDSGKKTFRHDKFEDYKGTRKELPTELVQQFPIVREYCEAQGYCYYQHDGLEADDIIGSLVKRYPDWDINVLSSDKDLLQLIDKTTSVWLMKKGLTEIEKMDEAALKEMWNLRPDQIPDLKGLMGDASDNIPGLPGVGEKTALKLLDEYGSVENVIANSSQLKGKLKLTVEEFHEKATFSKWLATIKTDAEFELNLNSALFQPNVFTANQFFTKYEMKTLIKEANVNNGHTSENMSFHDLNLTGMISIFAHYRLDQDWPHPILGLAFSDGERSCYLSYEELVKHPSALEMCENKKDLITYDIKSLMHAQTVDFKINSNVWDCMILGFTVDSNLNTYQKLADQYQWPSYPVAKLDEENTGLARQIALKMHASFKQMKETCEQEGLLKVYTDIDYPLVSVLYEMEKDGIRVNGAILDEIAESSLANLNRLAKDIYGFAGKEFNINSPKQLGEILFTHLNLSANRKLSTSIEVLESLRNDHPIIEPLIEYRKYQKIYSTYAVGLKKFILADQKIHTVYNMTTAQTGRLSSTDPNLQNISIKDEEAREIRKAFLPSENNVLFACDYSQIELRVLAHMADEKSLIDAFTHNIDIHTKTAMDVFGLKEEEINSKVRRQAKAVNFGIIYGISDFGLAAQIGTDRYTAKTFIEQYLKTYSGIKGYMDSTIAFCQANGYVETLFKRRRSIPEIDSSQYQVREFGKRAAMNAPIQGTAADIIKIAMIKIHQKLKENGYKTRMLISVHDELVFDVPKNELEEVRKLIEDTMIHAVDLNVPMDVSSSHGNNWYEAK
ncbi:MAG TPA: DNA polymerase I [Erysipelotrichaceae bacterium]|nr:DNA polymerase I [Erysipelotrichaceae bacterium]